MFYILYSILYYEIAYCDFLSKKTVLIMKKLFSSLLNVDCSSHDHSAVDQKAEVV